MTTAPPPAVSSGPREEEPPAGDTPRAAAGTDELGGGGGDARRRHPFWPVGIPVAVYAALGLAAYFPTWPGDPGRIPQCTCADAGLNTWFLAATAHAVAHGHSLFFTTALNYPDGVNLTYNTQMPLLGLLATPLTLTTGPVSSLNLLMWAAFPLSATSMFLVLRRWTTWVPAAFVGGLVYGFSPYMVGQSTAHLHLIFVPLPPLILLATFELFVRRSWRAWRAGLLLGLLVAGQFLISSEILVTTVLVAVVGLVVLAIARPREVVPALRFATTGLLSALAVTAAVLAYPASVFLGGPEHYPSTVGPGSGLLIRSDLLGPVLPTSFERLVPAAWASAGNSLTSLHVTSENGAYLGVPLLVVLVWLVLRFRRLPWMRLAAAMAVVAFVLSLGSPLSVDGRSTGIPLPGAVLGHLPLVDQLVPSRISLFCWLFVAVVLALGTDALRAAPSPGHDRVPRPVQWAGLGLVGALAIASLLPRWPNPTAPTGVPPYFTSSAVERIHPGTVALTYPYGAPLHAQPMVWQAVAGMRFSLIGGYALVPDKDGVPTLFPSLLAPPAVEQFLLEQDGGVPFYFAPAITDDAELVTEVRQFLVRYHVGVVLVDPTVRQAGAVERLVSRSLARPPVTGDGIDAWYDVQGDPALSAPVAPSAPSAPAA
jgi:hypothetical protein